MRISDWSSDVCSSDLARGAPNYGGTRSWRHREHQLRRRDQSAGGLEPLLRDQGGGAEDRKSVVSGKSVSVRVDLGGRRIIKKIKVKRCKSPHTVYSSVYVKVVHHWIYSKLNET